MQVGGYMLLVMVSKNCFIMIICIFIFFIIINNLFDYVFYSLERLRICPLLTILSLESVLGLSPQQALFFGLIKCGMNMWPYLPERVLR